MMDTITYLFWTYNSANGMLLPIIIWYLFGPIGVVLLYRHYRKYGAWYYSKFERDFIPNYYILTIIGGFVGFFIVILHLITFERDEEYEKNKGK